MDGISIFEQTAKFILGRKMRTVAAMLFVEGLLYLFVVSKGLGKEFLPFEVLVMVLSVISMFAAFHYRAEHNLLVVVLILLNLGFVVVQVEAGSSFYSRKTVGKLVFSIVVTFVMVAFYKKIMSLLSEDKTILLLMVTQSVISLAMVLFGKTVGNKDQQGASILLFGITFFELVKVLHIFVTAGLLCEKKEIPISRFRINRELLLIFHTLILTICMCIASEFGSLLMIYGINVVGFLVYGKNHKRVRNIIAVLLLFTLGILFLLTKVIYPMMIQGAIPAFTGPFSKLYRICTCLHPEYMAQSYGNQGTRALQGIVMGGEMGVIAERLRIRIPEGRNDFIFANLVQNCGLIMGMITILFLFAFLKKGIDIAIQCDNKYCSGYAFLTTALISFEAIYHIGYNVCILPISGIPLYFLSESFLAIMTGMNLVSILLVVSINRAKKDVGEDEKEVVHNRMTWIYFLFGSLFIFEMVCLFINSGVVPGLYQRADNIKVYSYAAINEETIMPGDIYDRNSDAIVKTNREGNTYETFYINSPLYCQVIGYTGNNCYDILATTTDRVIVGRNDYRLMAFLDEAENKCYGLYTPATLEGTKGHCVTVTIDSGVQEAVYEALKKEMDQKNEQGSAVVLDAKTGEILAMVSFPTFDANDKETMLQDMKTAYEKGLEPRFPVATKNAKAPGSIFKILIAVSLIDHGMEDFTVTNESFQVDDWTCTAHGYYSPTKTVEIGDEIDLETALNISSNVYFAQAALTLGKEKLQETAEKFLLIPNTTTRETDGNFVDETYMKLDFGNVDYNWDLEVPDNILAQTGFGQGKTELSTIYAAMMVQGIANHGIMMKPYLLKTIEDANGKVKYRGKSEIIGAVTNGGTSNTILQMMRSTAIECCNEYALWEEKVIFDQYEIAGKTGTAENGDEILSNNAWYVSVAPAGDPQYVVVVNQCGTDKCGYRMMGVVADIYTYLFEEYNQ